MIDREYWQKRHSSNEKGLNQLEEKVSTPNKKWIVEAQSIIDSLVEFIKRGDYSNGNIEGGADEGEYLAANHLRYLIDKWKGLLETVEVEKPSIELKIRRLLWLNHRCGQDQLYGDDGEMQCHLCGLDFLRHSEQRIVNTFNEIDLLNLSYYSSSITKKEVDIRLGELRLKNLLERE